ncbi:3-oxoacyl-ACP synthase III family protein [Chondromyces apiculatus]|uniref:3-oxoacyl-[acyl-carrier-protein] synthase, KASIII n=1 Tax=Chondromyces apiculatus DSM 436 TaxID=1192034 RepID=A0A017SUZ8_9BACT|nr:3-oxoacyl-ACP synthase III family protein [Chondromyces apiculatus]EYF00552.1 3-oxoacyl-[acyl-carrier-protein] synthase, KASIII [Chondromyces apiculatus DSM 436]
MIPSRILGTGTVLPGPPLDNAAAVKGARLLDPAWIEARTGVRARHWAPAEASISALAADALRLALDAAGLGPEALRRLIYVTSTGGEHVIPSMASDVVDALGLHGTCDSMDLNNTCVGFLTALDLAARCAHTGAGPVGIVVAEPFSRCITPEDPRPYVIFGDAFTATIVGSGGPAEGILGARFGTDRALGNVAWMPRTGMTGEPERITFKASNRTMSDLAVSTLVKTAEDVVRDAGFTLRDIAWVLPHQPNATMLQRIVEALGIDPARGVPMVAEVGSLGAASVPASLDRLLRTRDVRPGDHILMMSVGAGVSYGALLLQVGAEGMHRFTSRRRGTLPTLTEEA